MNAERRVELTGDPQIKKLLERIRELEEALKTAIERLDGVDQLYPWTSDLKAVLAKKEKASE